MQKGLLITCLLLILGLSFTNPLDRIAKQYIDDSLQEALIVYGGARGLNAGISVLQSTEVSIGVASVDIGEVLDPANDLIERFSSVMLFALTALGIQKILITIFASSIISSVIAIIIVLTMFDLLHKSKLRKNKLHCNSLLYRITLTLVVLRFSLVLITLFNMSIDKTFLEQHRVEATQDMKKAEEAIEEADEENQGMMAKLKRKASSFSNQISNPTQQFEEMQQRIDRAMTSMIDLITLFILQTLLIPIASLYLLMKFVQRVWHVSLSREAVT
ncbi:hypothetical protein N9R79_03650 [Vibrio sp.]|nr:hypothetical protein [Vibrio sp.]